MKIDNFAIALKSMQTRKAFRPFTVELKRGSTMEVYHPEALVTHGDVAVFFDRDNNISIFDFNAVARVRDSVGPGAAGGDGNAATATS